jgi:hypothetical protein
LVDREEQVKNLPNDLKKIQSFISARSRAQNPSGVRG